MIGSGLPLPGVAPSAPTSASAATPGTDAMPSATGGPRASNAAGDGGAADPSGFDRMLDDGSATATATPSSSPPASDAIDEAPAADQAPASAAPPAALPEQMLSLLASLAPPPAVPGATPPALPGAVATDPATTMALARAAQPQSGLPATGPLPLAAPGVAAPAAANGALPAFALATGREREVAGALDTVAGAAEVPVAGTSLPVGTGSLMIRETLPVAVAPQVVAMPTDPGAGLDDAFGANLLWMGEQKLGHAEIRVTPDHLGPIDVRVQLDGTRVRAEFFSAQPDVRQAIEASVTRLRDMLGQHGLQLAQTDVGHRHSRSPDGAPAQAGRESADADGPVVTPAPVRLRRGLLDTYA